MWIYFNDRGELLGAGTYGGYTFTEEAVRIITDHDQSAAPLAMYIAFQNIHPPLQVPQNYVEMQRNVSACPGHLCSEPSKVKHGNVFFAMPFYTKNAIILPRQARTNIGKALKNSVRYRSLYIR
eukprot:COSAG06_NODE_3660_length_5055_cov_2.790153_5_plen_124_part_00